MHLQHYQSSFDNNKCFACQPFCLSQRCRVWLAYALPGYRLAATLIVIMHINVGICTHIYTCKCVCLYVTTIKCTYVNIIALSSICNRQDAYFVPTNRYWQPNRQTDGQAATEAEHQPLPTVSACFCVCVIVWYVDVGKRNVALCADWCCIT